MIQNILPTTAFTVGFLSFLAPCILPLIPPYLAYLSGFSLTDGYKDLSKKQIRVKLFINALLFVLGFSLIFVFLGATASFFGQTLAPQRLLLQRIGAILIIIFGLYLMDFLKIPLLHRQKMIKLPPCLKNIEYLNSFLTGTVFAFGWVACIGPILASLLIIAGTTATVKQGIFLLSIYSAGLAIPFLLTSLFITEATSWIRKFSKWTQWTRFLAGGILLALGVLLLTDDFYKIVSWLYNLYNNLGIPLF